MPTRDVQGITAHWSATELATQIKRAKAADVGEILETLVTKSCTSGKNEKFSR